MDEEILGTPVAILAFIVLGNPASGGPLPTQVLPGIWRTLGPYLSNVAIAIGVAGSAPAVPEAALR